MGVEKRQYPRKYFALKATLLIEGSPFSQKNITFKIAFKKNLLYWKTFVLYKWPNAENRPFIRRPHKSYTRTTKIKFPNLPGEEKKKKKKKNPKTSRGKKKKKKKKKS